MPFGYARAFRLPAGSAAGLGRAAFFPLLLFPLSVTAAQPDDVAAAERTAIRDIAEIYARSMVTSGQAPGIGVAIIAGDGEPVFFTYGDALSGSGDSPPTPFSPDALFEIGSNTKVFTTNLLGQRVSDGELELDQPLSDFQAQLGTLQAPTSQMTLGMLADFTGGIADEAPLCRARHVPGCLPSGRPTIGQYTAADLASYFRSVVPRDFTVSPPVRSGLPAPYNYSNFSIGLLGLMLAAPPDEPLDSADVHRWFEEVRAEILEPLGMRDTFLHVPRRAADRKAGGYNLAIARAKVADGVITDISIENRGAFYEQPPLVRIEGGGGSDATAVATLDGKAVGEITVTRGGSGYIAPPRVVFNDGGSTVEASAEAIVSGDRVVGVIVRSGGTGYQRVPRVTISEGRRAAGRDAAATAYLVNGRVSFVTVDDPGAGYVQPLSVLVAPGGTSRNAIPVWAAAGALTSSLRDMAKFAQAALGNTGDSIPEQLIEGFEIAQRPYACQGTKNPSLAACPADALRSALAWQVQPADAANGVPAIVSKGGALPGYWSYITLMPERDLGVVVFMNTFPDDIHSVPEDVSHVAGNILYALYYDSL